jgi:spermidine synthase
MALVLLFLLFFASGACGLIYQVLWLRQLSLVFGVTVYAASTVLAAFMTGLAVGSLAAPRVLQQFKRPLLTFGIAEILIGCSALATPYVLDAATAVYGVTSRAYPDSLALLTTARLFCSFVVLLVPTVLMGLTLPLLSASPMVHGSGARISALYAMNTSGAVTGAMLAGYYLIGGYGMARTFIAAAAINVSIGLLAIALDPGVSSGASDTVGSRPAEEAPGDPRLRRVVLGVIALSGFASLALEIVWFRILLQFLTATTYAFTTMLATVLGGIATGGFIATRILATRRDVARIFATVLAWNGFAVVASLIFLSWSFNEGWRTSGMIQASAAAILPSAVLMGVGFPLGLRLASAGWEPGAPANIARDVGRVYAANVAGAILGALAGGFVVLPRLGSRNALVALASLFVVAAVAVAAARTRPRRVTIGLAAGLALFGVAATRVPDPYVTAIARRHGPEYREIWREEGAQTAVSVHVRGTGYVLFLDGLHQANDTADMVRLHRSIGHLPMVLHRDPKHALVIGLGGGATAGAVSQYPAARVDVVELSDSVIHGARFFKHVNYSVLERPNVSLRRDDGRNFLMFTTRRFDVITADIIQPDHAGAGNLYSREYFQLVRRALAEDGLVLQWIGHRRVAHYKLIMRTFLDVFPNATLWNGGSLLVGSVRPFHLDLSTIDRRRENPVTRTALDEIDLTSHDTLRSWYTGGPAEMRRFLGPGPVLTDDRPLLEYFRSVEGATEEPLDVGLLRGDVAHILVD